MATPSGSRHILLGAILLALGLISIMSIGFAIITIALVHLALYPVRQRREVVLPVMSGAVAFWVGFALVAPMRCSFREPPGDGECVSLAGITYPYDDPTFLPGLLAGVAAAGLAATLMWIVERRRATRQPR